MAKIKDPPNPPAPRFPWDVRVLVRPKQIDRPNKIKKKGDPKNPALASIWLLESIGPAHGSDELRLPMPPMPAGHEADLVAFTDRNYLGAFMERTFEDDPELEGRAFGMIRATHERKDRLDALVSRENAMLKLVKAVKADMDEIEMKRRQETREKGY